jgi:NitT/TauT family transport system substrate-binding protein
MRICTTILLVAIIALSGCSKAKPVTTLRVGTWKTQQTIQPYEYSKYLPKTVRCEVLPFTNPGDMKTALLAGSLDACGTTLVHAILSASKDEPVVLVCSLCNKCSALVVSEKSNIRSPGDLKGKRIGYVPSTMHHLLLLEVLHRANLKPEDVELIRVDFFDMVNAMSHGQIDAFLSGEPFPTLAVRQGIGRILSYPYFDDSVGPINAGMLVRRETMEKEPDKIRQMVRAHAEATRFLQQHPDDWVRRAAEFGQSPGVLKQAAQNIELTWDMNEKFVAQIKCLGDKMLERGLIQKLPDWDRLIATQFVAEVRNSKR